MPDDRATAVGRLLRSAREGAGSGLRELARRSFRSNSTLSDWELGKVLAPSSAVEDYERCLGLPRGALMRQYRAVVGCDPAPAPARRLADRSLEDAHVRAAYAEALSRRYATVLSNVCHQHVTNFTEVARYTYWIAEDDQDRVLEERVTTVWPGEPLRWRRFTAGALPGSGLIRFVEDLNLQTRRAGGVVEALPLTVDPRKIELAVFFLPPVHDGAVEWSVGYRWPQLWEPLRRTGRDEARVRFPAYTTRAEIAVVAPEGRRLRVTDRTPPEGELSDFGGEAAGSSPRTGIRWIIEQPDGFCQLSVQLV